MKMTLCSSLALMLLAVFCSVSNGKKANRLLFNGGDLRYTDAITETQATALGNFLITTGFYDGRAKTAQVDKENEVIHFAVVLLRDSMMNSATFQKLAETFINELQQNVFKNNTVEIDYCDKDFNVIKNIKGSLPVVIPVTALPVSTANLYEAITYNWVCNSLTGGDVSSADYRATDVQWLKEHFYFCFLEDSTFFCNFISPASMDKPVFIEGRYQITDSNISLDNLTFDGDYSDKEMHFGVKINEDSLALISKAPGRDDLVMSFVKVPGQ